MADIIYTGRDAAQVLQGGGQSFQALGQFSAQQQQYRRDELSKAIKDQDTFLNMLKTDPVYTASRKANEEIADSISGFVDKWGDIYRQKGGQLSTSDLADMQANKGAIVAKMNHFKASNDRILKESMEFQKNRHKYDPDEFYEALDVYDKTGFIPEGGLLQPAYVDPRKMLASDESLTPQLITRPMLDEQGRPMTDAFGNIVFEKTMSYLDPETGEKITDDQRRDEALRMYREDADYTYQWHKSFNGQPQAAKMQYAEMATNEGYNSPVEAMVATLAPRYLWQDYTKQSQIRSPRSTSPDDKSARWRRSGSRIYYGPKDNPLFFQEKINEPGLAQGIGVTFKQDNIKPFSVPISQLGLPENIVAPDDGSVDVLPMAADNKGAIKLKIESDLQQQVETTVRPKGRVDNLTKDIIYEKTTDDGRVVRISDDEYNNLPNKKSLVGRVFGGQEENYKEQYSPETIYRYTKPVEDRIIVTDVGNIGSYMANVIPDFVNAINNLFQSSDTQVNEPSSGQMARESNSQAITYTLRGGQKFTKEQLLNAGWTEADIKRLENEQKR